jgi:hypothetical protein
MAFITDPSAASIGIKRAVVTAAFLLDKTKCDSIGKLERIDGWDYFLYTNDASKVNAPGWTIREITPPFSKGVYCAKHIKWMTHLYLPDYDIIMWIDGFAMPNTRKKDTLNETAQRLLEAPETYSLPIILRKHPYLSTVESELNECIRLKKIDSKMKDTVVEYLKEQEYPISMKGLFWTEYIIKNNKCPKMIAFSETLFKFITEVCYRDQICFPFVLWKSSLTLSDKNIINDLSVWNGAKINHNYV